MRCTPYTRTMNITTQLCGGTCNQKESQMKISEKTSDPFVSHGLKRLEFFPEIQFQHCILIRRTQNQSTSSAISELRCRTAESSDNLLRGLHLGGLKQVITCTIREPKQTIFTSAPGRFVLRPGSLLLNTIFLKLCRVVLFQCSYSYFINNDKARKRISQKTHQTPKLKINLPID